MEILKFVKTSISFLLEKRKYHPNTRLMRLASFNEIQETLERITGRPALTILYKLGKKSAEYMVKEKEIDGVKRRTFNTMLKKGIEAGRSFNWFIISEVEMKNKKAKIVCSQTFESALHKKVDYPVCAFLRGYFEELVNMASKDKKYKCIETKCIAKGDDHCVFKIR